MIIKHAILHILDKNSGNLIASQGELNLNQVGLHEYFEKIINKFESADYKPGVLTGDDYLAKLIDVNNQESFSEQTTHLAEKLYNVIAASEEIPAGDLLSFEYSEGADDFFCLIKLNFAPRYAHIVDYQDDVMVNNLVLNQAVLPGTSQRPEEGIIVNLMTGDYHLLEKKYVIDGHRINYFSERFLELEPEESVKSNIQQIKKAVQHVADKYDVPEHEAMATTQHSIVEAAANTGQIDVVMVGEQVFGENIAAKQAYQETIQERQIENMIQIDHPDRVEKKYHLQRFKLDSGIELAIPMDVYQDHSKVEFINNPDGTMSLVLKDIESITNKFNS